MRKALLLPVAFVGLAAVAGCTQNINPTDTDRALIGAAAGAVIADVAGKNVLKGAALGAAGGALCNDVGVCQ